MIPTQATANMDDPREHVLWALVGALKDPYGNALITSEQALRDTSEVLTKAGFRHVPELQEIKQLIPEGVEGTHWLGTGVVEWVSIDAPVPVVETSPAAEVDLDAMSAEDLIRLAKKLEDRGVIRPEDPPTVVGDMAQISRAPEVD
ncbi:DUF2744 domain-containing protein [Streptomyces sp. NPDC058171]